MGGEELGKYITLTTDLSHYPRLYSLWHCCSFPFLGSAVQFGFPNFPLISASEYVLIITARVWSTMGGYIFSFLSVHKVEGEGGVLYPRGVPFLLPLPQLEQGYPFPPPARKVVPLPNPPQPGRGTTPSPLLPFPSDQDRGTPPDPSVPTFPARAGLALPVPLPIPPWTRTQNGCAMRGSMLLVFTQEDFFRIYGPVCQSDKFLQVHQVILPDQMKQVEGMKTQPHPTGIPQTREKESRTVQSQVETEETIQDKEYARKLYLAITNVDASSYVSHQNYLKLLVRASCQLIPFYNYSLELLFVTGCWIPGGIRDNWPFSNGSTT